MTPLKKKRAPKRNPAQNTPKGRGQKMKRYTFVGYWRKSHGLHIDSWVEYGKGKSVPEALKNAMSSLLDGDEDGSMKETVAADLEIVAVFEGRLVNKLETQPTPSLHKILGVPED